MKRCRINNERLNLTGFQNLLGLGRGAAVTVLAGIALLAAGLMGLGACHQDVAEIETPPSESKGKELTFRVSGSRPETYATQLTVGNIEAFCVNAILDDGVVSTAVSKPKLLYHQTVTRQFNSNTFTYEPRVYLPDGFSKMVVTAFAPVHIISESGQFELTTPIETGDNAFYYRMPDPANSGVQEDLLVAYAQIDSADLTGSAANVQLNFKHALSRVDIGIQNSTVGQIVIQEMKFNNVLVKGLLDLDAKAWPGPDKDTVDILDGYYTLPSSDNEYKTLWDIDFPSSVHEYGSLSWDLPNIAVKNNESTVITTDETALLVMPQVLDTCPDGDAELQVTYILNNLTEKKSLRLTDLIEAFEMGKQYQIWVIFDRASVGFTVTVDNWPVEEVIQ